MLTGLEIWMIESKVLATDFICRIQGNKSIGAPKINQLQPNLPVRLSKSNGSDSRGFISAIISQWDGVMNGRPTVFNENNQSCIKMCENPVMQKRTQHIAVKCHSVLEQREDESVLPRSWKPTCWKKPWARLRWINVVKPWLGTVWHWKIQFSLSWVSR